MSLLSNSTIGHEISILVNPLSYHEVFRADEQTSGLTPADAKEAVDDRECDRDKGVSLLELEELLSAARAEATSEAERRLGLAMDERLAKEASLIRQSIDAFNTERRQYFARVEAEVIQLSLAIAAKILHREAQADPMLLAAMVRIALDKLQDSSSVKLRVSPTEVDRWKEYMAQSSQGVTAEIVGDPQLGATGCILQANLGAVDFSIDAQLKEVEQGFFDLLAQRPIVP